MADAKITALTNDPSPTGDDLLVSVNDPLGTPANRNVKLSDLLHFLLPSGMMVNFAGEVVPSGWLGCDGSAISRSTNANLFAALSPAIGVFTVTIATPAVVTLNAHGFVTGDQVYLTTTGALPTGLTGNTLYYVIKIDANTFNLATTRANAYAATKINTTGSQSGVHTCNSCPHGLGDGSTTFNLPDTRGRILADTDQAQGRLSLTSTQGAYGNLGASGGEQSHTIVTAELASHSHTKANQFGAAGSSFSDATVWAQVNSGVGGSVANTGAAGSDTPHNIVQPTLVARCIIKT